MKTSAFELISYMRTHKYVNSIYSSFQKKNEIYLCRLFGVMVVSLSTKCKQTFFQIIFLTEKMSNELLLPQSFTDLVVYFV